MGVGRQGGKRRREGNRKKKDKERARREKKDLKYFKASGFPLSSEFKFQKSIIVFGCSRIFYGPFTLLGRAARLAKYAHWEGSHWPGGPGGPGGPGCPAGPVSP